MNVALRRPMTGGTAAHPVVGSDVFLALDPRLREPCRAFRGDLKVVVRDRVRCPDAVVTGSPVADDADAVPDPAAAFEAPSASTASVDRTPKAAEYQATASVQRHVMPEQPRAEAVVPSRGPDGWTEERVAGPDGAVRPAALGVEPPVAEPYRRTRGRLIPGPKSWPEPARVDIRYLTRLTGVDHLSRRRPSHR